MRREEGQRFPFETDTQGDGIIIGTESVGAAPSRDAPLLQIPPGAVAALSDNSLYGLNYAGR